MSHEEHVDGPAHYGGKDNLYEVIKVMVAWYGPTVTAAFCELNAVKYLARAAEKGTLVQDLRKAAWYATAAADLHESGELANR